jgi:hypothetical protein
MRAGLQEFLGMWHKYLAEFEWRRVTQPRWGWQ